MKKITRKDVIHIARLAKIDLLKSEIDTYIKEFQKIISYIDILSKVDTKKAKCKSFNSKKNIMREDKVTPSLGMQNALSMAQTYNGYFLIEDNNE